MSDWIYNGKVLTDDMIPSKAMGFIYIICQKSTGHRYIGRKLLTKAATKKINGKKKKLRAESDWRNYWSSSPKIKYWINQNGTDDFSREIIVFVSSKGMLAYAEEYALYTVGALESDQWINDNIRSKIYRSWVKPDEAKELRKALSLINNGLL